jgi:hypothetical protein
MTAEIFEREKAAVLETIPEPFHKFVARVSWEYGHSSGYEEVLNYMDDFIDGLEGAILAYENALTKTH